MLRFKGILVAGLLLLVGAHSSSAMERIVLSDVDGRRIAPLHGRNHKATVLIFITNDCPIANASAPEIERIYRQYAPKHVGFYLVYVDAALTASAARKHRAEYRYSCPAVLDPDHRLVKLALARVTPEAALFCADGKLVYHGRIDDRAIAFGQVRASPTRRDLREALDACLQGKPIPVNYVKAVGCTIADLGHKQ